MAVAAYEPNDIYDVSIYDHTGNLYHTLRQWDRLDYTQRLNNPWNHTLQVRVSPDDPVSGLLRNLVKDYFIVVHRFDPVTQQTDRVYEGFHATSREQTQTDGNIFFQLYGGGYTKLLDRRVVYPPPGQDNSKKTGPAETIAKEYVYESCVSPTGLTVTDDIAEMQQTTFIDTARIMPGLVVVPTEGRGVNTEYSARYTNLKSVVDKIANDSFLNYGIYGGDELGDFIFDVRPQWGIDRRVDNAAGNKPAVFSLDRGNMLIPLLSTNHRHEKNWVLAGGEGEGKRRIIAQAWDDEAILASPWSRSEFFQDNRRSDNYATTLAAARAALEERRTQIAFDFDIRNTRSSRWIRDWGLGDYITALYRDLTFERQVVEIGVVVTSGGQVTEQMSVDLEDIRQWEEILQEVAAS